MKGILLIFSLFIIRFGLAQPSSDPTNPISDSHSISANSPNVYMLNGRMGLQKNLNKPITPAVYDTLFMHSPTRYVGKRFNTTKQQSYWGIIDASGHLVIPFEYRVVKISESTVIVGLAEHNLIKYGAFSIDGREIISPIYESVEVLSAQLIAAKKGPHTVVFNSTGMKVFQAEADSISYLEQGYLKVNTNGKAGTSNI